MTTPNQRVYSRDRKHLGRTTGTVRHCQLEGCTGQRIGVRWRNGKLTWPCSKGMVELKSALQIR